jgi:predicted DNA-binding mobile mystery protein A
MGDVFKQIEREQCQEQVDRAASVLRKILGRSDWIGLMRRALGMNSAQLARRLGVSRNQAAKLERAEQDGRITLKRLEEVAQAMDCRLVYAFIPDKSVESMIRHQAEQKAKSLVNEASVHMMLEAQSLSPSLENRELQRVVDTLLKEMPRDLWNP